MHKKKRIAVILVVIVVLLAGIFLYHRIHVSVQPNEDGTGISIIGGADGPTSVFLAGKLGGDADGEYTSITMSEAQNFFETEGDYRILDVRTPEEYAEGHIPNAVNIANEEIGSDEIEELPDKDQVIYVYCRSGNRSRQAAEKLTALGYTNIIECGGIKDWTGETEK